MLCTTGLGDGSDRKKSWSKGTNWTAAGGVNQETMRAVRIKKGGGGGVKLGLTPPALHEDAFLILLGARNALMRQNSRQKAMLKDF